MNETKPGFRQSGDQPAKDRSILLWCAMRELLPALVQPAQLILRLGGNKSAQPVPSCGDHHQYRLNGLPRGIVFGVRESDGLAPIAGLQTLLFAGVGILEVEDRTPLKKAESLSLLHTMASACEVARSSVIELSKGCSEAV
jgi:hypothetical protein